MTTRRLGKYEIVERIGRGGMAEVYRAYHANLDRYVAIKVLHKFLADDTEFKARFEREAQNIARLRHQHIVQVYDFDYDRADESYYMVMELISGVTLKDRLFELESNNQKIPLEEALRITREAASALAYAHRAGMIHRDVKPANLMLDENENDRVVLTDFGIAKMFTGSQYTITGGLVGTPAYMSPEQGMGETGDERSDLYSIGVILYQMVTGELPYDADTPLALVLKHVNEAIPSACMINPALPVEVDDIIEKLMAKDMATRYQSASEVITDIQQLETDLASGLVVPSSSRPPEVHLIPPPQVAGDLEQPTVRLRDDKQNDLLRPPASRPVSGPPGDAGRRFVSVLGVLTGIGIGAAIYLFGARGGVFPGPFAQASPEATANISLVVDVTATSTPTETAEPITATTAPTSTLTLTRTMTATPRPSATPSRTPTDIPASATPTASYTPSPTANITQTLSAERTATFAACVFDYAIIEQNPADGDFATVNSNYTRTITLLNTGTCAWERNTSLAFISGESFNAGPRIFIREAVEVGQEFDLIFNARLPSRGDVRPLQGTWQLRTPGQIAIGLPIVISIFVYNPGN